MRITQQEYKKRIENRIKSLKEEKTDSNTIRLLNKGYIGAYELVIKDLEDYEFKP